jgi:hypothetical protein
MFGKLRSHGKTARMALHATLVAGAHGMHINALISTTVYAGVSTPGSNRSPPTHHGQHETKLEHTAHRIKTAARLSETTATFQTKQFP